MLKIYEIIFYFIIYAFFGWCLEVIYQAIEHGKFINRGFMNGPYCPIYGLGVVIIVNLLSPIKENILLLFIGSVLLTTALEFVTGFILEKIFHQKWWDYTEEKFNCKGYICLKFSLLWGIACLITVSMIHPIIETFVKNFPVFLGRILLAVIFAGFLSDFVITVLAVMKIRKRMILLESISAEMRKLSDYTGEKIYDKVTEIRERSEVRSEKNEERRRRMEQLKERYRSIIEKRGFNSRRIEHAFPRLELKKKIEKYMNQDDGCDDDE